jgi:hypothetical protein
MIGTKFGLSHFISSITRVSEEFLLGKELSGAPIAARMAWAAKRKITREENIAYCLLGIFAVRLPLLYEEGGRNAIFRLQEELLRTSDDQSLFAWQADDDFIFTSATESRIPELQRSHRSLCYYSDFTPGILRLRRRSSCGIGALSDTLNLGNVSKSFKFLPRAAYDLVASNEYFTEAGLLPCSGI